MIIVLFNRTDSLSCLNIRYCYHYYYCYYYYYYYYYYSNVLATHKPEIMNSRHKLLTYIKHVNKMQRPICASLTMSESTLLIAFHCLFSYSFYFIRLTALLQSSQIDKLMYTPMLFIASLRCLTCRDFDFFVSLFPLPFNLFDYLRSCRKKPQIRVCVNSISHKAFLFFNSPQA